MGSILTDCETPHSPHWEDGKVCVCVCPCFYKEHLEESQVEIKSNRNGNQPSQGVAVSPTIWPIS